MIDVQPWDLVAFIPFAELGIVGLPSPSAGSGDALNLGAAGGGFVVDAGLMEL